MPQMPPDQSHRAELLLDFWFAPESASEHDRLREVWFEATPEFDAALAERFSRRLRSRGDGGLRAVAGRAADLSRSDPAAGPISRNLFRNSPQAYATDAAALQIAREAVARGYDRLVAPVRRCFFYLPFQHSESLADQETGIRLYAALSEHPDKAAFAEAARQHCAIIARFGRFPHRNHILGRADTPEECEFLQQPDAAF